MTLRNSELSFDEIRCRPVMKLEARGGKKRLWILVLQWLSPEEMRRKIAATSALFYRLTWDKEVLVNLLELSLGF